jgi:capsular polysaccharide biosynthesis protein
MDLNLFLAVLWRSRRLLLAGVGLGVVLAVLVYAKPGFSNGPTLTPRGSEVWQSESQMLIAQAGFPYRQGAETAEPARSMGSLSPIYANLANGGAVQAEIHKQLGPTGTVKASEDVDLAASSFLPFVNFVASAPTKEQATKLARGAASIFEAFVTRQQEADGVPPEKRIQVTAVQAGVNTKLSEGHDLSVPILVFLVVLIASVSLIFLKENVRPRVAERLAALEADSQAASAPAGASPASPTSPVSAASAPRDPGSWEPDLASRELSADAALPATLQAVPPPARDPHTASANGNDRTGEGAPVHSGDPVGSGVGTGRRW